ncbi:MAG: hypothetical protein AB7R89_17630 [Dehalococcoidia bacterium]
MTTITNEQAETTNQLAAKLQAFYDGLTDDERAMCILGVRRLVAGEEADTEGYMKPVYDDGSGNKARPGARNLDDPVTGGLIPYRTNGPILYTMITPTYQTEV